jgi:hypothetical protein
MVGRIDLFGFVSILSDFSCDFTAAAIDFERDFIFPAHACMQIWAPDAPGGDLPSAADMGDPAGLPPTVGR